MINVQSLSAVYLSGTKITNTGKIFLNTNGRKKEIS